MFLKRHAVNIAMPSEGVYGLIKRIKQGKKERSLAFHVRIRDHSESQTALL